MPKVNNLKLTYERLVNTGNFENEKFGVELSVTILEGDNFDEVLKGMEDVSRREVNRMCDNIKKIAGNY